MKAFGRSDDGLLVAIERPAEFERRASTASVPLLVKNENSSCGGVSIESVLASIARSGSNKS